MLQPLKGANVVRNDGGYFIQVGPVEPFDPVWIQPAEDLPHLSRIGVAIVVFIFNKRQKIPKVERIKLGRQVLKKLDHLVPNLAVQLVKASAGSPDGGAADLGAIHPYMIHDSERRLRGCIALLLTEIDC